MAGETLDAFDLKPAEPEQIAVKEAVLPFARFPGVDTLLGPEMRSTGEVMGFDTSFERAFLKSQLGAGVTLPEGGTVFVSVKDTDKGPIMAEAVETMASLGFDLIATEGTAAWLGEIGLKAARVNKVYEGRPHVVDRMKDGAVQLVFNTTEGTQSVEDSRDIRSVALYDKIPYYTTAAGARAVARALRNAREGELGVM
ncbi:MAG: carbamoyl phosphate synthase large subunit, partial [Pseudomonadota bacterium]